MADVPQNKVLEVIKNKVMSVDDRYEGYHTDLTKTLYEVFALESYRPRDIAQEVSRQVTALGRRLLKKEGNLE